jgi:hypothetical protein
MDNPIEIISPELKVEMLNDHFRYFHITFPNTSRERVELWANYVENGILNVPANGSYCNIFDISQASIFLTPYLRARGTHLYKIIEGRTAFVGFVVKNTIFTQFIAFFARGFDTDKVKTTIFYSREEDIQWGKTNLAQTRKERPEHEF